MITRFIKYSVFRLKIKRRIQAKEKIYGLFLIKSAKKLLKQKLKDKNNIQKINMELNQKNKELERRLSVLEKESKSKLSRKDYNEVYSHLKDTIEYLSVENERLKSEKQDICTIM